MPVSRLSHTPLFRFDPEWSCCGNCLWISVCRDPEWFTAFALLFVDLPRIWGTLAIPVEKKFQESMVSLNVPIEHHPAIRYMVYNGYYKVMSNIPKMGQLPTPGNPWCVIPKRTRHLLKHQCRGSWHRAALSPWADRAAFSHCLFRAPKSSQCQLDRHQKSQSLTSHTCIAKENIILLAIRFGSWDKALEQSDQ